jgi:ethanolamine utilization protein EutN
MRDAKVIGSITSTVKHPCLTGKKLLLVQVLNAKGEPEGKPQIVVDFTGAGKGDRVLLSWDGIGSQEYHNNPTVPQRAWLCGIIDETDND